MATEISLPTLNELTNYELWKQETLAWTVKPDLGKEKQAVAVALNLPGDGKNKIKEKVFCELKLDDLNSENGMCILFEFLDKYLLDDELMTSLNKFEDFDNFERKQGQNIREYVANFELKVSKLEKLNIKLPSEILALKLLRKANLSKQDRMIVLTGVNFADKGNIYKEMKNSLIKFMGELTERKAGKGSNVRPEPAWKKSTSSSNWKWYVQHGSIGVKKKKLNPLGSDGQILLCNSCGSYRHLVAKCPDSWENMVEGKANEVTVELRDQTDEQKLKGKEKRSGEESHIVDKQVSAEMAQLKEEIRKLKAEIKEIKAVKDKELKGQKEELLNGKNIFEQKKEQREDSWITMQKLIQSIMEKEMRVSEEEMVELAKLQGQMFRKELKSDNTLMRLLGEDLSRMIREMKVNLSEGDKLSLDGPYSRLKTKALKTWGPVGVAWGQRHIRNKVERKKQRW